MRATVSVPDRSDADSLQIANGGVQIAVRLGYLTHGLIYGMTGALALMAAIGAGGRVTDKEGAVRALGAMTEGQLLLWPMAAGLGCYALWNAVRALFDPERRSHSLWEKVVNRTHYAVSAISHALLSVYTFQLAREDASVEHGLPIGFAHVYEAPGGRVLVALIGAGVIVFGLLELKRGIEDKVHAEFNGTSPPRSLLWMARLGHAARGVVFAIVGGSVLVAALEADPSAAASFGEALRALADRPFGHVLLGVVSAGLVAFGVHQLCLALYARIPARVHGL